MSFDFLKAGRFWIAALIALAAIGLLFAYELNMLDFVGLEGPVRAMSPLSQVFMAIFVALLFSINIGLIAWYRGQGTCPIGVKGAAGAAGILGAIGLLCPICLAAPLGLAGAGVAIGMLAPFSPLIQIIAIVLLGAGLWLLMPRHVTK